MASAVILAMTPEGPVKGAGRLICGLILLLALLRPLSALESLTLPLLPAWPPEAGEGASAGDRAESFQRQVIEERLSAYIEERAAALGASCDAAVECRETDGIPAPWSSAVAGDLTEEQKRTLSQGIEEDLGIPPERQSYRPSGG